MKYNPTHNYELSSATNQNSGTNAVTKSNSNPTNELIKLKNLLDQGAITNDDYTTVKVKILSSNNEYDYNNSIADEIIKLKELLDSTLLTKDEYVSQKNKLVNAK